MNLYIGRWEPDCTGNVFGIIISFSVEKFLKKAVILLILRMNKGTMVCVAIVFLIGYFENIEHHYLRSAVSIAGLFLYNSDTLR